MKQIKFVLLACLVSTSAFATAPVDPKIEEVVFQKDTVELSLPLTSDSILAQAWPKQLGTLEAHLQNSYTSACNSLAYDLITKQFNIPIHSSEIPELDQEMSGQDSSIFQNASCLKPAIAANKSGFSQAVGAMKLTITKPHMFEESDRRLYKISMPWTKTSGWGTGTDDAKLYASACSVQKSQGGSALMVNCSAPEMAVSCCGNAALTGQMTALVFAYSDNKLSSVVNTADSPLALTSLNEQVLASKAKDLGNRLAFSICTPANWEYSPVMAYQSTCYILEHNYVSASPASQFCVGDVTADTRIWVLQKHDASVGRDYIQVTARFPRLQTGQGDYVTATNAGLKTDAGAVFKVNADKTASLTGANLLVKDLPATPLTLNCK